MNAQLSSTKKTCDCACKQLVCAEMRGFSTHAGSLVSPPTCGRGKEKNNQRRRRAGERETSVKAARLDGSQWRGRDGECSRRRWRGGGHYSHLISKSCAATFFSLRLRGMTRRPARWIPWLRLLLPLDSLFSGRLPGRDFLTLRRSRRRSPVTCATWLLRQRTLGPLVV